MGVTYPRLPSRPINPSISRYACFANADFTPMAIFLKNGPVTEGDAREQQATYKWDKSLMLVIPPPHPQYPRQPHYPKDSQHPG